MEMEQAAIEARREYHRKWQRKNADKVKRYKERYWEKKAAAAAAAGKEEDQDDKGSEE